MKIINPIQIWQNGVNVEANRMSLTVQDNLKDAASFYYTLYADDSAVVNSGIAMGGEDYVNWNNDEDINNAAYEWVASKINVEIIGDYIPPAPEPEPTLEQTPKSEPEPVVITSDGNVGMANINPTSELEITPEPTVQESLTTEEPIVE